MIQLAKSGTKNYLKQIRLKNITFHIVLESMVQTSIIAVFKIDHII